MAKVEEFPLDMDAEVKANQAQNKPQVNAETSTEIAARIGELMRAQGVDDEANPLAAEKIQRDLLWQRQVETLPQPEGLERPQDVTPELDRLEQLQRELETAKAETAKWKKEFGRREGKVGGMEARIRELEARVSQVPVPVDVRAMTGRDPSEALTAQDVVNLMMAQSQAFGKTIQQMKEEVMNSNTTKDDGLPLDLEAELVEAHPWLTDLSRPAKMRAMHDILASSGVTVTPPAPGNTAQAAPQTAVLPEAARAQVRQAAFIEPSNKGSAAERNAIAPERQAYNERMAKLKEALSKPGGSDKAAEILTSLGAGPVDETQIGYMHNRR